ncbi:hypothetical protein CL616_02965 [archaeon]|nr:hypothetical protein [archaeon]
MEFLIGILIWIIAGIIIGSYLTIKIRNIQSNFQKEIRKIRIYLLIFFLLISIIFIILWTQGIL